MEIKLINNLNPADEPDGYAVVVDGFEIVFIDLDPETMLANVRVYDGYTNVADVDVSLTKDRN